MYLGVFGVFCIISGSFCFCNRVLFSLFVYMSKSKTICLEHIEQQNDRLYVFRALFLLSSIKTKGLYGVCRTEETKLVCAISRKVILG